MNVEILSDSDIKQRKIVIPIEHCPEHMWNSNLSEWKEEEYNYRLNTCDTIYFAVVNNKIVGHLGLNENSIKALYIDPNFRSFRLSYQLYEHLFLDFQYVESDDAREPVANKIWERLSKKYSSLIQYDQKRDVYIYDNRLK